MTPAASGAVAPLRIVQARASFGPGRQVGLQAERLEADPGELGEARTPPGRPTAAAPAPRRRAAPPARTRSWRRGTRPRPAPRARELGPQVGVGQLVRVEVEDVQERLGREQVQLAQSARSIPAPAPAYRVVPVSRTFARGLGGLQRRTLRSLLVRASFCRRGSAFSMVCRSARISSVLIVSMSRPGADLAVDVGDVGVGEDPDDLADRVGLADVGEELVAPPLPLGRALDHARDVDELDLGREDLRASRRSPPACPDGSRARRRCPRWARSWRTGSSPRGRSFLVRALKRVDLPTLGRPTMPMLRLTCHEFRGLGGCAGHRRPRPPQARLPVWHAMPGIIQTVDVMALAADW